MLAYAGRPALVAISMAVGACTSPVKRLLDRAVDRFVFRDRHVQRVALKLSFAGILTRCDDGSYELERSHRWPPDCVVRLDEADPLTRAIARARGPLPNANDTRPIQQAFPRERLTFAAPILIDRRVRQIVVYGHNVSGLDLDPDEREQLTVVVANAAIALTALGRVPSGVG